MHRAVVFGLILFFSAFCAPGCNKFAPREPAPVKLMPVAEKAATAEEMLYQHAATGEAHYANSLDELLAYDPSLTDDPQITFQFDAVSEGYRFHVRRGATGPQVVCEPESGCREVKSEK
jgi:hypothetical protein